MDVPKKKTVIRVEIVQKGCPAPVWKKLSEDHRRGVEIAKAREEAANKEQGKPKGGGKGKNKGRTGTDPFKTAKNSYRPWCNNWQ